VVETKNIILIIGEIGSGKSALANVLSGTKVFKENSSSLTEIWRVKDKEFEVIDEKEKTKYRVIDTIGFSESVTKDELIEKFEEEVGAYIDQGVNQIFFVIDNLKLLEKVFTKFFWINESFFDNKALDYTTIIRTKFTHFRGKTKRDKEDKETERLVKKFSDEEKYKEIITKVLENKKIVYVDNGSEALREFSRNELFKFLKNLNLSKCYRPIAREWLNEWLKQNYPLENEVNKIFVLDISDQKLKGRLSLKGFINLRALNCSDNQLTSLDLSDCSNLVELKCNNNQLTNLNFLKSVGNLEKLELQNNKNLSPQSLKILGTLDKLEELNINDTNNISEGWECLLKSCQKLYCNSEKIVEELDKKSVEDKKQYYNLDTWRKIDKQNKLTADVIPLERFFIIRNNIKKFVDKWGIKEKTEADNPQWYTKYKYLDYAQVPFNKLSELLTKQKQGNLTELSKLQSPAQYEKNWYWTVPQWGGRGVVGISGILGISGSLSFEGYKIGAIAVASPIVETITSHAKSN
jgi:GTPase Era involved in 16S rRNA processing